MRQSREGTCKFEGCGRKILARRLCAGHYTQDRTGQELRPLKGRAIPWQDRVEMYTIEGADDECWTWSGGHTTNPEGGKYAVFTYRNKTVGAHRAVYEKHFGKPPEGYHIDHQCRNTSCVNPAHLKAVTPGENMQNKTAYRNSKTGIRGVSPYYQGGFVVHVGDGTGRNVYGGKYDTIEEAARAAIELRNKMYTNNVLDRA